jgi:hypothetical protein
VVTFLFLFSPNDISLGERVVQQPVQDEQHFYLATADCGGLFYGVFFQQDGYVVDLLDWHGRREEEQTADSVAAAVCVRLLMRPHVFLPSISSSTRAGERAHRRKVPTPKS